MSGNIFDQFDGASAGGNVFDQFDESPAPEVIPTPKEVKKNAFGHAIYPQSEMVPVEGFEVKPPKIEQKSGLEGIADAFTTGIGNVGRATKATANTYAGNRGAVEDTAKAQAAVPKAKELDAFMKDYTDRIAKSKGKNDDVGVLDAIGDFAAAAWDNPMGATQSMVEQLPNAGPVLAAGFAGAKVGAIGGTAVAPGVGTAVGAVAGAFAGMFLGNTILETGNKAMEKSKDGFTEEERASAIREGATKGAVIAGVDLATLGIGSVAMKTIGKNAVKAGAMAEAKVLMDAGVDVTSKTAIANALTTQQALRESAKAAGKAAAKAELSAAAKAGRAGVGLTLETIGEGGGEYLGEEVATGKGNVADAVMEGFMGAGQSAAETAYNYNRAYGAGDAGKIADAGQGIPGTEPPVSADTESTTPLGAAQEPETVPPGMAEPSDLQMQNRDRGTVSSITQMRSIANAPDFDRLGASPIADVGAPLVSVKENADGTVAPGDIGGSSEITLPDGAKVPFRYAVVDAGAIMASHDANGKINSDYGNAQAGQVVALTNGRVAGLQAAYASGVATQPGGYMDRLLESGEQFGISPDAITGKAAPVLVRLYDDAINARPDIGKMSNSGGSMRMSAQEVARNDARVLPDIGGLVLGENGEIDTPANQPFIRGFVQAMPDAERAELLDRDGRLSQVGMRRVRNAIIHRAYGESPVFGRLVESMDSGMANLSKALIRAAPKVAQVKELMAAGAARDMDITGTLVRAVSELDAMRKNGLSLADFLAQARLLDQLPPGLIEVLSFLDSNLRAPSRIAAFIESYYQQVESLGDPRTPDMFGAPEVSPGQMLNTAATAAQEVQDGSDGTGAEFGDGTGAGESDAAVAGGVAGSEISSAVPGGDQSSEGIIEQTAGAGEGSGGASAGVADGLQRLATAAETDESGQAGGVEQDGSVADRGISPSGRNDAGRVDDPAGATAPGGGEVEPARIDDGDAEAVAPTPEPEQPDTKETVGSKIAAELKAKKKPAKPKQDQAQSETDQDARDAAMAELGQGIDELVSLLGGKTNMMPEEEARFLPIMSKIFRAAAKLGYIEFKTAGRFVLESIRAKSAEVADKLTIDNLQAGYINIARDIGGDKRAAMDVESIEELMGVEPVPAKGVSAEPGATGRKIAREISGRRGEIERIDAAAHEAATSHQNDLPQPTPSQKEANNYKMGHVTLHGMDISIENPAGSERVAVDGSWRVTMPVHYGYIKRTEGADGDHVDVFIGPNPEQKRAWIINQREPLDGEPNAAEAKFDEHKVMLGFKTADEAMAAYFKSFEGNFGRKVFQSISPSFDIDELKIWLPKLKKARPVKADKATTEQVAKGGAPKLDYADFKKKYTDLFNRMMRYSPKQVGSSVLSEEMAALSDAYPEFAERAESEVEKDGAGGTTGDITEPSVTRRANPGNVADQSFVARAFLNDGNVPIQGVGATKADALLDMKRDADRKRIDKSGKTVYDESTEDQDAGTLQPEGVPAVGAGRDGADAVAGDGNSKPLDAGVADAGKKPSGSRDLFDAPDGAGSQGTAGVSGAGKQPSGTARDSGTVRTKPGATSDGESADHVVDAEDIGKGGLTKKYRDNIAAIRIIKAMEAEARIATPEERKQIARYVGWGAIKGVFDPANKQWAKQHAELKELLTEAEFAAARRSTLDAHYTSPTVVQAMFDALGIIGFKGGRILEPSVGVGNFFGMMPPDMRNASALHGVELDSLTARLAAALYPKAKITQSGFEDFAIPAEYFDAVIGNPPFGSQPIVDAVRSPYSGFSIHNYFLAKAIDKLRPGGIMQVVVSHNFLDAQDSRARKWIADRADLIAGVRLPDTAFKENAGTEVVTDILIFRKRAAGFSGDSAWVAVGEQSNTNPKTGETVKHNVGRYFIDNPGNVLGTPSAGGSMYSANEYTVTANGDLKEQLAGWVKMLPANLYTPITRSAESEVDMAIPDGVKEGSFFVNESGVVMQRGADVMGSKKATAWTPKNATSIERMKGMIGLRDAMRAQMRMERSADAPLDAIEANRKNLNQLYDAFLKKFGHLNSTTNRSLFFDDTEANLLQGLEFDFDRGISDAVAKKEGIEPKPASAKKADIFTRRVAFPPTDAMIVKTAKDALLASLNYRGKVDLPYMEQTYSKPADEIVAELGDAVFDDPQSGIVTADEYLSGDVKTKLAEAVEAAKADQRYSRNVEALEKVIPADKVPSEISVNIGAPYIPEEIYQQFLKIISGGSARMGYVKATGQWAVQFDTASDPALNVGKFGTEQLDAKSLFSLTLLGRGAIVKQVQKNPDGSTTTVVLEKETEAAREKQNAIKAEWQKWLWEDADRADRVASIYNEKMNRIVNRAFDGSHMTFPGMNPAITLLPHQKNGVWRGLQSYRVLYDHSVGAGKTFIMATLAMEMRRTGMARKPVFVVPNHLTLQWRSEFNRLYPGGNVLAAMPEDFSKDKRDRLFAKIATGDWDAVVIGHSSLKKIGLPEATERAVLEEQINELADAIEDMKRERGDRNIIRDMEKIKANIEAKMKAKLAAIGSRTKMMTFDELGLDALFVDEMHEFKNLNYHSTMDRVPGMGSPSGSDKAFDMFVKVRWLFDTFGDKAPFITATGTPVSNSLVEMFNMQRYMQYPTLKREGLHVFDAWARQFGKVESVYEVAPSGSGYRQSSRFSKFTNLPALMGFYNEFADTITLDDLKAQEVARGKVFPVPKMTGGKPTNIVAPRSPQVAALMGVPKAKTDESGAIAFKADLDKEILIVQNEKTEKYGLKIGDAHHGAFETEQEARLKVAELAITPDMSVDEHSILGRFGNLKKLFKDTKGKVNALSLTSEANKAGLDFRLINPSAPDFAGSKINLAVAEMMRIYHQWGKDKGTQLVFCDMSIPLSARSSYSSKARRLYIRVDGALEMKRGTMHTAPGWETLPYFVLSRGEKESKRFDTFDAASGARIASDFHSKDDAVDAMAGIVADAAKRERWLDMRMDAGEITQEEIDEYNNDNENEVDDAELFFTREDIAGMSGSAKFSVYDDIKAKLMAKGVPEREIAFIHDYSTPVAKAKLFRRVNDGDVRFLLGSTPKMGAGTNVQERAVGLHHIDAPWRPSDLEQREGRIIRQGNHLYRRDPDGFEVFIGRYATEQTYDTRRWQILEHKARGIEQLRNYDGTFTEIDDIEGEAANSADMKAAASGDPLILEETRARNDVKRLEQLQSSHADEKLALTRRAAISERTANETLPQRIKELSALVAVIDKHPVKPKVFTSVTVDGKQYADREAAEKAVASTFGLVRTGLRERGAIVYRGLEFRIDRPYENTVAIVQSATDDSVGVWGATESVSPSGVIQRLANYAERLPARIEQDQSAIQNNLREAAAMREQVKQPFAQAEDLTKAREAHKSVQRALMTKGPVVPEEQKQAVNEAIKQQKRKLKELGYGDSLRELLDNSSTGDTAFSRADKGEFSSTNPDISYARTAVGGIHEEDFNAAIATARRAFPGLKIHGLTDESDPDTPDALRADIDEAEANGDVAGALHDGEVYLFQGGLRDVEHAERTVLHEATHAGLRRMFGDEIGMVLLDLHKSNLRLQLRASKIKNKYGYSTVRSIDEALADMGPDAAKLTGWRKLVAWVRDKLRAYGFVTQWTDADVDALVLRALAAAKNPVNHVTRGSVFAQNGTGRSREAFAATFLQELAASEPDLFRYPTSQAKTLQGVFKDVFPGVTYHGEHTLTEERRDTGADHRYVFTTPDVPAHDGKPERKGFQFTVFTTDDGKLWLDIHRSEPGAGGSNVYAALANYAYNTGKVFGGDPAGVSPSAMIARTKMMLSSALRHGTTRHLDASREQEKGIPDAGIEPLEWYGRDIDRLRALIHTFITTAQNQAPDIKNYSYDFAKQRFIDSRTGKEFRSTSAAFNAALGESQSRSAGIGEASGRAAVLIQSLIREEGRGIGDGGILQAVLDGPSALVDGGLRGAFSRTDKTRFSRTNQPEPTAQPDLRTSSLKRVEEILRRKASGETITDKVFRLPMQALGVTKATAMAGDVVRKIAGAAPESVKAGVISDYGLPKDVIDERDAMFGHQRKQLRGVGELMERMAGMTREESRIAYEWLNNRDADDLLEQLPEKSRGDMIGIKQQIDALGQEAVSLGLLSADAYESHKNAYVHRSYRKWDIDSTKGERKTRSRAQQILGEQFKARGLTELAPMQRVQNTNPVFWKRKLKTGKADADLKGEEFIRFERRKKPVGTAALDGMEAQQPGKVVEVQYWPKAEPVPARYGAWHEAGTFTVRGTKGDSLVMHRDWTKAEREKMGEIDEARYAIAKTFHQMIHDIEVAKYLRYVAGHHGKETPPVGVRPTEAKETLLATFGKDDWVEVPRTTVSGTSVLKFGALAGLYVPGPIWNDIRQVTAARYQPLGETYATILKAWKLSKTALSPGVHINNIMANFVMADWHDVRAADVLEALSYVVRSNDPAHKELLGRFEDAGGTQGMYILSEIQRDQLAPLIEQLRAEVNKAGEMHGMVGASAALQSMLHGRMKDAYEIARGAKAGQLSAAAVKKLMDLYQAEDTVFRLAAFIKAKREGLTDQAAGKIARRSFLDYQINAPWIQVMRQTALPFISFTYRAVPMLLKTIETKPWKIAKLAAFAGLLNALGYAMSGGDEDKERRYMPKEKAGKVWGMVPKLIRMPWNDGHDNPVFLDIRRWIPVGDVFDIGQNHAALPLIPVAIPGGPIALLAELLANKSQFTGRPITKETDTLGESAAAVADHLYKAFAPNIILLPGTYAADGAYNAARGRTDTFGREQSVGMAMASGFGVKLGAYPTDELRRNASIRVRGQLSEIDRGIRALVRERSRNGMTDAELADKIEAANMKRRRVMEEFQK
jgi:N12 class adenine-specific DNA methylase